MSRVVLPLAVFVVLAAPLGVFFSVPLLYVWTTTAVALFALLRTIGDIVWAACQPSCPSPEASQRGIEPVATPAPDTPLPVSEAVGSRAAMQTFRRLDWFLGVVVGILGVLSAVGLLLTIGQSFKESVNLAPYSQALSAAMDSEGWQVYVVAVAVLIVFIWGVVKSRTAKKCWAAWSAKQWIAWLACLLVVCGLVLPRMMGAMERDTSLPRGGPAYSWCLIDAPDINLLCW